MFNTRPVMGVIAVFSILFNGTLCIVILRKREMLRKSYHLLIFVLAITDTLTGIFMILSPTLVMGRNAYTVPSGIAGHLFCHIVVSTFVVFMCGKFSIGLVTCMAIERWFAIARPTRYKALFTRRRVLYYIFALLLWYLLWSIHALMEVQLTTINSKATCKGKVLVTNKYLTKTWAVSYSAVTVVLPLLLVCGTFVHLRFVVRKQVGTSARPAIRNRAIMEIKLTRMSMAVATSLAICFLPIQTVFVLRKFGLFKFASREFLSTVILSMMNSWVNPWLYCLTNRTYKKEFIRLLCPCKNSPRSLFQGPKKERNGIVITPVSYKEATDLTRL